MTNRGRAVALVGPTATGKSALAHQLALELHDDVEILAVDAMTVYRGMDLATAKPTPTERADVTYHLLDLCEASDEFTLAQYQRHARDAAASVTQRGRAALYTGGTGLYGRAVLDDFEIPGQFPEVRADLQARVESEGDELYELLTRLDPLAASRMEATNLRRLVRALEVTIGSGRAFSSFGAGLHTYGPVRVIQVGLRIDIRELDRRIATRFHRWMDQGLLAEVATIANAPGGLSRTARQAVGYRELLRHLEDGVALATCVDDAIHQSRRLARRQRSWFRRDPRIEWFDDADDATDRLRDVLKRADEFVRD